MIKITKGLDVPVDKEPVQEIQSLLLSQEVGFLGSDYPGLKPNLKVQEGDQITQGDELFVDKTNPSLRVVSHVSGKVIAIHRGAQRKFQSLVIARNDEPDVVRFDSLSKVDLNGISKKEATDFLIETGLWGGFRTRPFNKVPQLEQIADAVFVNLMDSNSLSCYPGVVLEKYKTEFDIGLQLVSKLTEGPIYLCHDSVLRYTGKTGNQIKQVPFSGPHPAGLVGTHIHHLHPVSLERMVFHIHYQDVIAVGHAIRSGTLWGNRIVAVAGPLIKKPRLVEVSYGSNIGRLLDSELQETKSNVRWVSGPLLSGHHAKESNDFLGRYHLQIGALEDEIPRALLGWQMPGFDQFSATDAFASGLFRFLKFRFNTGLKGSKRSLVPIGIYEKIMPFDIEWVFLLKSLLVKDTEQAVKLGALELAEEDMGLLSFVCPTKEDYAPYLRSVLDYVEKEG